MREYRLIRQAAAAFELDLTNCGVLTEAASNAFLWTPIVAAMAGADPVIAVGGNSRWASFDSLRRETRTHAKALGVAERIHVVDAKEPALLAQCQLVTNLGFVRPLDAATVSHLPEGAVISLMWEPWELRPEEIDLAACQRHGIAVLGTNESDPRLRTFDFVAVTVARLLLEQNIELLGAEVLLLGVGPFVDATRSLLERIGVRVHVLPAEAVSESWGFLDAIVCLEHTDRQHLVIGPGGLLDERTPVETDCVIHLCGPLDVAVIRRRGWRLVPDEPAPPGRMSFTTAHAGPKPVIDLHTAGLKVGEAFLRKDRETLGKLALPLRG